MRGRKRKPSGKSADETKEQAPEVQDCKGNKSTDKIVPNFGKKKKMSNVKTSAKNDNSVQDDRLANTQTTIADVHREADGQVDDSRLAHIKPPEHNTKSDDAKESSKEMIDGTTTESEAALAETTHIDLESQIELNPEGSQEIKTSNEVQNERSSKLTEQDQNDSNLEPKKDIPEIQTNQDANDKSNEHTPNSNQPAAAPELSNISSFQFDPSGDAKPFQSITKDDQNTIETFGKIDTSEAIRNSVKNGDSAPEPSPELFRNADLNVTVTETAPTKDDGDQSDASTTLRDLSYEEESQESVVEVHKLLDYHFENFPKAPETKTPIFGVGHGITDVADSFIAESTSQKEDLLASGSLDTPITATQSFGVQNVSTEEPERAVALQNLQPQSSNDQNINRTASDQAKTPDFTIPPTQGFSAYGIDFPISATQNFNINYSPLISITPDSSNPASPGPVADKDTTVESANASTSVQGESKCHSDVKPEIESELQVKPKGNSYTESEISLKSQSNVKFQSHTDNMALVSEPHHSQTSTDSPNKRQRLDKNVNHTMKVFEETSAMDTDSKADTEEQCSVPNLEKDLSKNNHITAGMTQQMSFSIRPSTSKNDMLKQVDLIHHEDRPSAIDNNLVEEVMGMEDDFGVTDSQMCAIDYEEPMMVPPNSCQQRTPSQGAVPYKSTSQATRPDEEGHNIMQGLIKDVSSLNKMLLKTKREMEAFRRSRGFTPLQNKNWQQ